MGEGLISKSRKDTYSNNIKIIKPNSRNCENFFFILRSTYNLPVIVFKILLVIEALQGSVYIMQA